MHADEEDSKALQVSRVRNTKVTDDRMSSVPGFEQAKKEGDTLAALDCKLKVAAAISDPELGVARQGVQSFKGVLQRARRVQIRGTVGIVRRWKRCPSSVYLLNG